MLLSAAQAAKILSVSPETLRRWQSEGKLHADKTEGGHRRYDFDAVLRFKDQLANINSQPLEAFRWSVVVSGALVIKNGKPELEFDRQDITGYPASESAPEFLMGHLQARTLVADWPGIDRYTEQKNERDNYILCPNFGKDASICFVFSADSLDKALIEQWVEDITTKIKEDLLDLKPIVAVTGFETEGLPTRIFDYS